MDHSQLLHEIERFMSEQDIGEHRFGMLAVNNGRLVERLREGRRIWPETEDRIRTFIAERGKEAQRVEAAE